MQSLSSRIWTRVAVSISYKDNHYTTGTSYAELCIAVDIANFEGDVKLFLCVAYWIYLIHIQLGTLGLREIDARRP